MVTGNKLTPEERSLRARIGAHSLHAQRDPSDTTANGRAAFLSRFEQEVDPTGTLPAEERHRRATHARRAYFARLALASAKARRAKRERATSHTKKPPVQAAGGEV